MPNWCVGTLKVRGEKEDLKRFLLEGLTPVSGLPAAFGGKQPPKKVKETDYSLEISTEGAFGFYIEETHRNFIDQKSISWYLDEGNVLVLEDFQAAWGIDPGPLADLSKKYNLDFKIYAYERGMQFNMNIEIHKGTVITCETIKFDDYDWECPEPNRGG
ncbi:hypothetical protein PA598K_01452 [Paenibacillus sp. 598K]|uniref:hypothetical protein n=1 Tax=Paenibacillus sp. 598K TaxID=1117987 RepID=UPI000FFA5680|nr:hypothetical protein [Paenibacillus sp. 598K]GBF73167.1 hypothetical protein PA598K_01452 [Paenibacillus sp. 598K]